ncbi:MAG: hypothetical protein R3F59_20060 [Myxococcota bacterium]
MLAQWPDAQAAIDARDVHGLDAVWYWAHGEHSVDGFGVTLVLVDHRPNVGTVFDPIDDLPGRFKLRKPSLLFFDQTDGPPSEWPIIGAGYHYRFTPCVRPDLDCIRSKWFRVHEAGYHHVPFGDGGMQLATPDDLRNGAVMDEAACEPITDDDLAPKLGMVRHGRSWVVHVWFDPDGGRPAVSIEDPWARWEDAPDSVAIDEEVFVEQDAAACDCTSPPVPREPTGGCG